MKIKMKSLAAGPTGVLLPDRVYSTPTDLSEAEAEALVRGGFAVPVTAAEIETQAAPADVVETAVVHPPGSSVETKAAKKAAKKAEAED